MNPNHDERFMFYKTKCKRTLALDRANGMIWDITEKPTVYWGALGPANKRWHAHRVGVDNRYFKTFSDALVWIVGEADSETPVHVDIALGGKDQPNRCPGCEKTFKSASLLGRHMATKCKGLRTGSK